MRLIVIMLLNWSMSSKVRDSCWVMIAPTNFNPTIGQFPSLESIREDINTLYIFGFGGLGTYASDGTLYHIPRIARERGFNGKIIQGIWDPRNSLEITNAIMCSSYVDGYCIGNEGLGIHYDTIVLKRAMDSVRSVTGKPVTTSEQIEDYLGGSYSQWLLTHGDWLFPIAHPYWHGIKTPQKAVDWTVLMFDSLSSITTKQIILKEVGLPSAGCIECSEDSQAQYYRLLEQTDVVFFYFEAFDQPWKTWDPVEPHWGLFRSDRTPKKVAHGIGYNEPKIEYKFSLNQNFPNPFSSETNISYSIDREGCVILRIYDISGCLVSTIVNSLQWPGFYSVTWDGKDSLGKEVSPGIYFYKLTSNDATITKKMTILR